MKLIKQLFIFISVSVLVACSNTVSVEDIETFQSYQSELEEKITMYATKKLSEDEILSYLNEFESFIQESAFPEELQNKQLEAIKLYKKGIKEDDSEKITQAAIVNYEAMNLFDELVEDI